jgi:hypothetical protein
LALNESGKFVQVWGERVMRGNAVKVNGFLVQIEIVIAGVQALLALAGGACTPSTEVFSTKF